MGSTGLLALRLSVLLVLFLVFLIMERRQQRVGVVLLVLGIVVAEVVLYPDTKAAAVRSIFHPMLFGQSFRITQLIIPAALLARLLTSGLPRRLDASAPFWAAFFAWTGVAVVVGLMEGHQTGLVFGEGAMIIHVGGMMLLAAGVPAQDYLAGRSLERFLQVTAGVAATLFTVDMLGVRWTGRVLPDLPLVEFGDLGPDAATVFSALGVVALVLGLARPRHLGRRVALVLPGIILILSHLGSTQRAARLGLYVTLVVVLVVVFLPTARRRLGISPNVAGFAALCVLALGLAGVFVPAVVNVAAPNSSLGAPSAFAPESSQTSIVSRFNQWNVVRERIADKALLGEGLGGTFVSYSEGHKTLSKGNISHNIVLDLLRRVGLVGFVLALAGFVAVVVQAAAAWRFHPSTPIAALAFASVAAVVGLLAKGMVESIFEKYRLAVLLGCLLGWAISAAISWNQVRWVWVGRTPAEQPTAEILPRG